MAVFVYRGLDLNQIYVNHLSLAKYQQLCIPDLYPTGEM